MGVCERLGKVGEGFDGCVLGGGRGGNDSGGDDWWGYEWVVGCESGLFSWKLDKEEMGILEDAF